MDEDDTIDLEDITGESEPPLDISYFIDDDCEEFEADDLDLILEDF